MARTIFPFASGGLIKAAFSKFQGRDGVVINAEAKAADSVDAVAYGALVDRLATGRGDDRIDAEAAALAGETAEARGVSIGDLTGAREVGRGQANLGRGDDTVTGSAFAKVKGDDALEADASGMTVDRGSVFATGAGDDRLRLSATAVAESDAVRSDLIVQASGLESLGTTLLGDGNDRVFGKASADSTGIENKATLAFGITQLTADGGNAGPLNTSAAHVTSDNDTLIGRAAAAGDEEVGAFGVLVTDAETGVGRDRVFGKANADGVGSVDARGVSVGLSDIDDDTLGNPNKEPSVITAEVGEMHTGAGDDLIRGEANVTADATFAPLFFAGANGIVVDGGTDEQFLTLKAENPHLTNAQIAAMLDTSTLETGDGDDRLVADVTLNVIGGDPEEGDLEVIADGIENAGTIDLGDGNDEVFSRVSLTSVGAAAGLADALDNSSVGIITGLELEVNAATLFDMGNGDDHFESHISAHVTGDLAAADGLGNRGTFMAGAGNDTFDLNATAVFQRDLRNPGQQEEGIADGWENRKNVFLGSGDDTVTANAKAFGNGILTIAEGIESRELFNAGAGDDMFDLEARATSTRGVLAENLTQAAGLQTEQIDSGEFLLGEGDNEVYGRAFANSDGLHNKETFAFGITQITADATNFNDAGLIEAGSGNDVLDGEAHAVGEADVESFGVLLTNAEIGAGDNTVDGFAEAFGASFAQANGVAIGFSENLPVADDEMPDPHDEPEEPTMEAGILVTEDGRDVIIGEAHSTTTSGRGQVFNDADAVLVDLESELHTGAGKDRIEGFAKAVDNGAGGDGTEESAVVADGFENRGMVNTGDGDDVIDGTGVTHANNTFAVAGGIDNGLGSTQADIPVRPVLETGSGVDQLLGSATSSAKGANAFAGGIENFGTIDTGSGGDILEAHADSTVRRGTDTLSNADGIDNRFVLETGDGDDQLNAVVTATNDLGVAVAIGVRNDLGDEPGGNMITLGRGDDGMSGDATAVANGGIARAFGISNAGTIETGNGSDTVIGSADAHSVLAKAVGIFVAEGSLLSTGNGNDVVRGDAVATGRGSEAFGIAGGGTIDTGNGRDEVYACSFGEGVVIHTGNGKDTVTGFGDATVDGGNGQDRLVFEFDFFHHGGDAVETEDGIDFVLDGITLVSRDFEEFEINGSVFDHGDVLMA